LESEQRLEVVKRNGKDHKVSNCLSKNRCRSCLSRIMRYCITTALCSLNLHNHLLLLQPGGAVAYSQPQFSGAPTYASSQANPIGAASNAHAQSDAKKGLQVILATAMVLVQDSLGPESAFWNFQQQAFLMEFLLLKNLDREKDN